MLTELFNSIKEHNLANGSIWNIGQIKNLNSIIDIKISYFNWYEINFQQESCKLYYR